MIFKIIISIMFVVSVKPVDAVKVSIYYEALCSDSVNFIARQLYPSYSQLKSHLKLEFVPYGKAIHNLVNNKWQFDCQHGPQECNGNKYQACLLAQNHGQDRDVSAINCIMRERNPASVEKIKLCAGRFAFNWTAISECATTRRGDDLLAQHGDKTNKLFWGMSFVPTILYDDEYDDHLQDMSLTRFPAVVCSKLTVNKPPYCDNQALPEKRSFFIW